MTKTVVVFVALLWFLFLPGVALATDGFPGGVRDPEVWYFCVSSRHDTDGMDYVGDVWTALECVDLLWQLDPGGVTYSSLLFEQSVTVVGFPAESEAANIKTYIAPSQGVKSYDFSCTGFAEVCRVNSGGSKSVFVYVDDAVWFGGATYAAGAPMTPAAVGECAATNVDWAGSRSTTFYDKFWSVPIVAGTDLYPNFEADARTLDDSISGSAGLSCQITGWVEWAEWLETHPPWLPYIPPAAGFDILPVPISTIPIPHPPTTIEFGISDPITDEVCYTLIPSTEREVAWWSGVYTVGFDAVEVCNVERSVSLVVDEFDFGGIATTLATLLGAGALWALLRARG